MRYLMRNARYGATLLLLALLAVPSPQLHAANTPYEIDVQELDKQHRTGNPPYQIDIRELDKQRTPAAEKSQGKKHGKSRKGRTATPREGKNGYVRYTVRPGDHIFKILTVRFGMSDDAAERLVPEIKRVNHISDIRKLRVGQTLLIPAGGKEGAAGSAKRGDGQREEPAEAAAMLEAASRTEAQGAAAQTPPRAPEPTEPPSATHTPARPVPEPVWICSVTEKDPGGVVDHILNALSIPWTRNKILVSGENSPTPYSIRVDRYFEYKGGRYIVSIGQTDPYSYALIRLLEGAGYRTATVELSDDFRTETEKVLRLIGGAPEFGRHTLQGGKEAQGFLIQSYDAGGRRVVITSEKADPGLDWVMKPGCLVR
jgi:hypothetical protein